MRNLPGLPAAPQFSSLFDTVRAQSLESLGDDKPGPETRRFLAWLDGFLTACAIGPERISPEEWVEVIFGDTRPSASDEGHGLLLAALIMLSDQIINSLKHAPEDYEPVIFRLAGEGEETELGAEWADGFFRGMRLRPEPCAALIDSQQGKELLSPIAVLLNDDNGDSLLFRGRTAEEIAEIRQTGLDYLDVAVLDIYDYWRKKRKSAPAPSTWAAPKVGRNDPCPCGSGQKFKRCCLN